MIIEHAVDSRSGDSRRLLTALLIAILLHILFFAALAIIRLAENPSPLPVSVDLAPGTLGGLAVGPGPLAPAQPVVRQPGRAQASRSGSDQGFVIPTPRQGSSTEGYQPTGPSFREEGSRAARPSSAQQATSPVQEPVFPSSKTSQQGTGPVTTGGGTQGGAPAKGVGVVVQGGGNTPAKGSLDLGSLDASAASARGTGPGTEEGGGGGGGGGGGSSAASGGGGKGSYRFRWDQPEAGQARKLLDAPQPKIPLWVSKEGLSLTVLISFTLTPDGILDDVNIEGSSGYNEVDAAVSEAIRHWRFSPDPSARPIHGLIPYAIRAR